MLIIKYANILTHNRFLALSLPYPYLTIRQTFYITNTHVCNVFETISGIVETM